jgi:hypothetical protein
LFISDPVPASRGIRERERKEGRKEGNETHDADFLQVAHEARLQLAVEHVLDRHANEDLARAYQVHDDAEAVERAEYAREEAVRDALPVRLHVQHDDALLDRHRRREPRARHPRAAVEGAVPEDPVDKGGIKVGVRCCFRLVVRFRVDDRAAAARILNVLDAYGDFSTDDLVGGGVL